MNKRREVRQLGEKRGCGKVAGWRNDTEGRQGRQSKAKGRRVVEWWAAGRGKREGTKMKVVGPSFSISSGLREQYRGIPAPPAPKP